MWKHYGLYLNTNDPDDAALIEVLDRCARSRRVGKYLRDACLAQMKRLAGAASTFIPPALGTTLTAIPAAADPVMSSAAVDSVVEKARKAFFK